jgi:hypothetical protein
LRPAVRPATLCIQKEPPGATEAQMRTKQLVGWISIAALLLLVAHFGASAWFCAGALKGDPIGCASMIVAEMARASLIQGMAIAASAGLIFALLRPRR